MITVLSLIEIYPEREDAWHETWRSIQPNFQTAEGWRSVRLFRDADHRERYFVLSEWDDRALYDSFIRYIGVPWLWDAWEYGPRPAVVMFLEEAPPG
jgi:heme-degrading monooxygenase HmoA